MNVKVFKFKDRGRARDFECLWNRSADQIIFENHSGVENLQELYLTYMKDIKAAVLLSAITNTNLASFSNSFSSNASSYHSKISFYLSNVLFYQNYLVFVLQFIIVTYYVAIFILFQTAGHLQTVPV